MTFIETNNDFNNQKSIRSQVNTRENSLFEQLNDSTVLPRLMYADINRSFCLFWQKGKSCFSCQIITARNNNRGADIGGAFFPRWIISACNYNRGFRIISAKIYSFFSFANSCFFRQTKTARNYNRGYNKDKKINAGL